MQRSKGSSLPYMLLQMVLLACALCMGANLQRYLRRPTPYRGDAQHVPPPVVRLSLKLGNVDGPRMPNGTRDTDARFADVAEQLDAPARPVATSSPLGLDNALPSTDPTDRTEARQYFLCSDDPARCGFVLLHFCMNATTLGAIERTETAEEGFWNAIMAAARMRALLNASSPIVLMTNYRRGHIAALRRAYEENQAVLRGEGIGDVAEDAYAADDLVATGGGTVHDTNFEWMELPRRPTNGTTTAEAGDQSRRGVVDGLDERSHTGLLRLRGAPWPFLNDADILSLRGATADGDDAASVMRIKPDVLSYLVPQRGIARTAAATGNGAVPCPEPPTTDRLTADRLRGLCGQVARWMYLDSDTLVQNRSISSWRFKDDDRSVLTDEALGRQQRGTSHHLDAVFLRGAVAVDGVSRGRQRRWSAPLGHALYHALDLLAHDHLVMVPELNHQRDMGPWLYQDLLNASVYPDGATGFIDGRAPYAYAYPFERQFNTGLIGFRGHPCQGPAPLCARRSVGGGAGAAAVGAFFRYWSSVHQATPRCRHDRVAWDQCSLPRALRAMAHTVRVQSTWEPFDARDALGRGCSTILFANTLRDLRMNREHAIVLHRHAAKGFLRAAIKAAWGGHFFDALVYNASRHL